MPSHSRIVLEELLSDIDVRGAVLDIGGSQKPIKGRTKTWNPSKYVILDLAKPHEGERPDVIIDIQKNQDSEEVFHDNSRKYDMAFCVEVSEYWYDPITALKNISRLLKQGGTLWISFHFVYPVHNPERLDYLRYTRHGILRIMEESGFTVEKVIPRYFRSAGSLRDLVAKEGMKAVVGTALEEQGYLVKATSK